LLERLLEQIGRLKPLVGGEQLLQRLAPRKGDVLPPGEQRVPLSLDERFVLPREPAVFGSAHLVERLSEVPNDVELLEQDRRLGGVLLRGLQEGLPHVHRSDLDPLALLRSQPLAEGIHGSFRAVWATEPDGPLPDQVAGHDPVGMPLADRHFVDPDDLRPRGASSPELLPHVLLLQLLDRVPVHAHVLGNVPDAGAAASPADVVGEPLRVEGIVVEKRKRLPLRLPAPFAKDPSNRDLQVHPRVAAGEILDETDLVVVEGPVNRPAGSAQSFSPSVRDGGCGPWGRRRSLGRSRQVGSRGTGKDRGGDGVFARGKLARYFEGRKHHNLQIHLHLTEMSGENLPAHSHEEP